jgi:hypothetical protein
MSSNLITLLEKKLGSERKQQKNLAGTWQTKGRYIWFGRQKKEPNYL